MDVDGGASSTHPPVVSNLKEGPSTSNNALTVVEDSASTSQCTYYSHPIRGVAIYW